MNGAAHSYGWGMRRSARIPDIHPVDVQESWTDLKADSAPRSRA